MSNATRKVDADLDLNGNTIMNALVSGYYSSSEVDSKLANFRPDLNIVQDGSGISISGTQLQTASETQDGLMSKALITELKGKQDKLIEGAGIKIDSNNTISIVGGSSGGHLASLKTISSAEKKDGGYYEVIHNLGSYNLIFQIRTSTSPVEYVQARVVAPNENTLWIYLSSDLSSDETLEMSILACDIMS